MHARFPILALTAALLSTGCDALPEEPTQPLPTAPDPTPGAPGPTGGTGATGGSGAHPAPPLPARIEVTPLQWTGPTFAGSIRGLYVSAYDANGNAISPATTHISLSDPSRARLWVNTGTLHQNIILLYLRFEQPGPVTITAQRGDIVGTIEVAALDDPPPTNAVRIDDFAVHEFRAPCAWECPYLVYAPTLRVAETLGATPRLYAFDFTLGGERPGFCVENAPLAANQTREFTGIAPYLWDNFAIVVRLDGTPIPSDSATARVIVQHNDGSFGLVEARGPVRRVGSIDAMPGPRTPPWSC